ncbi:MAG: tetratricopeptide repeat protein [Sulfuricurvum sp.]|nr:tetratricopeptide repeat protein [Sulfuricurvum sp.]
MSLKENMQALKEELNSEEKFFESAVRTERFVKKYQKPMIASVVVLLLALGGSVGYQSYQESKNKRANEALNTLLSNPSDQSAMKALADNSSSLYELYTLSKALREKDANTLKTLQSASSPEVSDIATYESAVLANNANALEAYSKKQGSLYQELAIIELAVLRIQKGDSKAANASLGLIKEDSAIYPLAQMLSHYGVK